MTQVYQPVLKQLEVERLSRMSPAARRLASEGARGRDLLATWQLDWARKPDIDNPRPAH